MKVATALTRLADGLDGLLSNFVGSAQIGPYVAPDPGVRELDPDCPSCGCPISRHGTERTAAIGRLYCPTSPDSTGYHRLGTRGGGRPRARH